LGPENPGKISEKTREKHLLHNTGKSKYSHVKNMIKMMYFGPEIAEFFPNFPKFPKMQNFAHFSEISGNSGQKSKASCVNVVHFVYILHNILHKKVVNFPKLQTF